MCVLDLFFMVKKVKKKKRVKKTKEKRKYKKRITCLFCGKPINDKDYVSLITTKNGVVVGESFYHFEPDRNCWLDFFNKAVNNKINGIKDNVLNFFKDFGGVVNLKDLLKGFGNGKK